MSPIQNKLWNYIQFDASTDIETKVQCCMFDCRNMSLIGGVVLLLAESRVEARSSFAGLPSTGENKLKEYLQVRLWT